MKENGLIIFLMEKENIAKMEKLLKVYLDLVKLSEKKMGKKNDENKNKNYGKIFLIK